MQVAGTTGSASTLEVSNGDNLSLKVDNQGGVLSGPLTVSDTMGPSGSQQPTLSVSGRAERAPRADWQSAPLPSCVWVAAACLEAVEAGMAI